MTSLDEICCVDLSKMFIRHKYNLFYDVLLKDTFIMDFYPNIFHS